MITLICSLDKFSFKDYCTCFLTGQRVLPYRQTGKWHHECEIRDFVAECVCVCVCVLRLLRATMTQQHAMLCGHPFS
jgi:hypothetical protein